MVKVMVVCAHPGDEVLGCGGTLALHALRGDEIRVLVLGDGWTSRAKSADAGFAIMDLDVLEDQGRTALERLGVDRVTYQRFPDNRFDNVCTLDVVKTIEEARDSFQPDVVYTNSPYDLNVDQQVTCRAVVTAFRPQPGARPVSLYAFETPSSTEWNFAAVGHAFTPNAFVDITASLEVKLEAYRKLHSEVRPWPHARSTEALEHRARARGASVGVEAAEAFVLLRTMLDVG